MPIINRPDYTIFASEAKTGEITDFPNLLRGWGVTIDQTAGKPPMEWFNALQKRTDEWLTYLSQRGIPEWDNELDYPEYAVVQFGGGFYVSNKKNIGQQPDRSQIAWKTMINFLGVSDELVNLKKLIDEKLAKDQNGADIPDPMLFIKNLGLGDAAKLPAITFNRNNRGYMIIPTSQGDAILQWGHAACANEGSASVGLLNYFPIPFPNRCFMLVMSHTGYFPSTAGILSYFIENNSTFRCYSSVAKSESVAGSYYAIGY